MDLVNTDFSKFMHLNRPHPADMGGHQIVLRFPNGFGASVVRSPHSYGGSDGLFELAVVLFDNEDYYLTYDTPITDDVIGHLTQNDCIEIFHKIMALVPNKPLNSDRAKSS